MKEKIWRKVTYPTIRQNYYLISECGEVRNILTGKVLTPYPDRDGYLKYTLRGNEKKTISITAHRLVAWQYVGNPHNYPVIDHIDGIKTHNHYSNLEWVTVAENNLRAGSLGLRNNKGEGNGSAKWTEEIVRGVCEKLQDGWSIKDIYRWLKSDPTIKTIDHDSEYYLIMKLRKRETWNHITCEYTYTSENLLPEMRSNPVPQTNNYKYSEDVIIDVCERLQRGESVLDITEHYTGERKARQPFYMFVKSIYNRDNWSNISKDYDFSKVKPDRQYGCYSDIADMVDAGMTKAEIRRALGVYQWTGKPADEINRMVDRYKKAKSLGREIDIYERIEE